MSILKRWWVRFQLYWKGVPEPSQRYPPTRRPKEVRENELMRLKNMPRIYYDCDDLEDENR